MTMQQVRWAAQHDWFLGSSGCPHKGLTVEVRDYEPEAGDWVPTVARFDSFAELRAWAGY